MHPAERKCTVMDADGNADRIEYEIKDDVMCDDEECGELSFFFLEIDIVMFQLPK